MATINHTVTCERRGYWNFSDNLNGNIFEIQSVLAVARCAILAA